MPKQDVSTVVLKRLVARRKEVQRRFKERMSAIGFGKTQLGIGEFQKQANADGDFRQSMGQQYGPEVMSKLMEGSNAPQSSQQQPIGQPATEIGPETGGGPEPGNGPVEQRGSLPAGY